MGIFSAWSSWYPWFAFSNNYHNDNLKFHSEPFSLQIFIALQKEKETEKTMSLRSDDGGKNALKSDNIDLCNKIASPPPYVSRQGQMTEPWSLPGLVDGSLLENLESKALPDKASPNRIQH